LKWTIKVEVVLHVDIWLSIVIDGVPYALYLVLILYMLSRLRNKGPPPDPASLHYSTEHVSLAKTLGRRRWLMNKLDERIPLIR
jgi:hypothetical protein